MRSSKQHHINKNKTKKAKYTETSTYQHTRDSSRFRTALPQQQIATKKGSRVCATNKEKTKRGAQPMHAAASRLCVNGPLLIVPCSSLFECVPHIPLRNPPLPIDLGAATHRTQQRKRVMGSRKEQRQRRRGNVEEGKVTDTSLSKCAIAFTSLLASTLFILLLF